MAAVRDPYAVLGVGRSATAQELRTAYRDKCLLLHPDRHPSASPAAFQAVQAAWELVRDESSRRLHDSQAYHVPRQRRPRYQREVDEAASPDDRAPRRPASQTSCPVPIVCVGTVGSGSGGCGEPAFCLPACSDPCVLRLHPPGALDALPPAARLELLSRLAETALPPGLAAPGEVAADGGVLEVVGHTCFTLVLEAGAEALLEPSERGGASPDGGAAEDGKVKSLAGGKEKGPAGGKEKARCVSPAGSCRSADGGSGGAQLVYGVSCLVRDCPPPAGSPAHAALHRPEAALSAVFALSPLPLHALMLQRLHSCCTALRQPPDADGRPLPAPQTGAALFSYGPALFSAWRLLQTPLALGEPEMLPELLYMGDRFDPLALVQAAGAETVLRTLKLLYMEPRLLVRAVGVRGGGWRRRPEQQRTPPGRRRPPHEVMQADMAAAYLKEASGHFGSPVAAAAEASAAAATSLAAASALAAAANAALPAAAPPPLPPPHLSGTVALCLASLTPNGLVPPPPPPPLQQTEAHARAPTALGRSMPVLPSVSHWDVFRLLPKIAPAADGASDGGRGEEGCFAGWLAGAADVSAGQMLAPLAQAVLEVRYSAGEASAGVCGASLRVEDQALRIACRLTASELALAARLDTACREPILGAWEGSGGWVRAQLHAHFVQLGREAAANVLTGNANFLSSSCGGAWVRMWARTVNFQQWAAAAGVHAAARLWRARLDAEGGPGGPAKQNPLQHLPPHPLPPNQLPPPVSPPMGGAAAGVREAGGRLLRWFRHGSLPSLPPSADAGRATAGDADPDPPAISGIRGAISFGEAEAAGEAAEAGGAHHAGGSYLGGVSRRGLRHGTGVWWSDDRRRAYLGEWVRGEPDGGGAEVLRAGGGAVVEVYVGGWTRGARSGWGRELSLQARQCYGGEWAAGKREGEGALLSWIDDGASPPSVLDPHAAAVDGAIGVGRRRVEHYEGSWRAGSRTGFGVSVCVGRERFEGEWSGGDRCGVGRCTWPDGSSYAGEWFEGERHGAGTLAGASGDRVVGWWAKGELVSDSNGGLCPDSAAGLFPGSGSACAVPAQDGVAGGGGGAGSAVLEGGTEARPRPPVGQTDGAPALAGASAAPVAAAPVARGARAIAADLVHRSCEGARVRAALRRIPVSAVATAADGARRDGEWTGSGQRRPTA